MLARLASLWGSIVLMLLAFMVFIILLGIAYKWFQIQTETQFIVNSMSRFGGYTQVAEQSLDNFCSYYGMDRSKFTVTVSPTAPPAIYGENVFVKVSYPINQTLNYMGQPPIPFNMTLTNSAFGISTFIESMNPGSPIQALYVSP